MPPRTGVVAVGADTVIGATTTGFTLVGLTLAGSAVLAVGAWVKLIESRMFAVALSEVITYFT